MKSDFEGLLAEFNKISEKDATATASASKDNKAATLTGGKQLVITEDVYKQIVEKIKSVRNSYTLTK